MTKSIDQETFITIATKCASKEFQIGTLDHLRCMCALAKMLEVFKDEEYIDCIQNT